MTKEKAAWIVILEDTANAHESLRIKDWAEVTISLVESERQTRVEYALEILNTCREPFKPGFVEQEEWDEAVQALKGGITNENGEQAKKDREENREVRGGILRTGESDKGGN